MIDYERVVREFGERIFHVHAKDMEIDRDGLYQHGDLSARHRLAGPAAAGARRGALGPLHRRALRAVGYDGVVSIEHEDRAVRGRRGAGQARLPARAERAPPADRVRLEASDLAVRLLPERGLDLAEAWLDGVQLAWLSGAGFDGEEWGGGLVTTRGLQNVGAPSRAFRSTAITTTSLRR